MGKQIKRKPRTLRGVLGWYLAGTLGGCALVVLVMVGGLLYMVETGLLLPAYKMSELAARVVQEQEGQPALRRETLPASICRWALLESPGSDVVLATNMGNWHLENARAALRGEKGHFGYSQFYAAAEYQDGTVLLLQYDYAVHYADPALDSHLPDFQTVHISLLLGLLALTLVVNTRRTERFLQREADKLTAASRRIAARDLESLAAAQADVKEFDEALDALRTLSKNLSDSLKGRWEEEQTHAKQIAMLSHELKTPLAIIQGNGELLAEEELSVPQQKKVQAILDAAGEANGHLHALRKATAEVYGQSRRESKRQ